MKNIFKQNTCLHTGEVKYAPRMIDARKTTKYNTF